MKSKIITKKLDKDEINFNSSLSLEKISFSYDTHTNIFSNISAVIKKNHTIGIKEKMAQVKVQLLR